MIEHRCVIVIASVAKQSGSYQSATEEMRRLCSSPSSPTLPARAGQVLPGGEGSSYLFVIPKESMALISLSFRFVLRIF
jgi:hypothetical protein